MVLDSILYLHLILSADEVKNRDLMTEGGQDDPVWKHRVCSVNLSFGYS